MAQAIATQASANHYGFMLSEELVILRDQIRRFMLLDIKLKLVVEMKSH